MANPNQPATAKIGALVVLARIKTRRGEPDANSLLLEAKVLALDTNEHQRIIPLAIACLEFEWVTGKQVMSVDELDKSIDLVKKSDNIFLNSEFAFWIRKARSHKMEPSELYEPYQNLNSGRLALAVDFWERKKCAFEKAIFLSQGNEDDKRNALAILRDMELNAVVEKLKLEMRSAGMVKIPRGVRQSTKTNPAQLTNRELDVLKLLRSGIANKEIAGSLFISTKTVDHHISSILFKLEVKSRAKAVHEAARLGILK